MKLLSIRRSRFALVAALVSGLLVISTAWAAEPVGIRTIDVRSRTVTAEPVSGRTSKIRSIQFKVADAALLRTLKVGQVVYADLGTRKVSIDPQQAEPVGVVVGSQAAAPVNDSQTQATGQAMQNAPGDPFGRGGRPYKVTDDYPANCSTCAADCKKCSDQNMNCNCTYVGTDTDTGEPIHHCTCSGPNPKLPKRGP